VPKNVFQFDSYRTLLKELLLEKKAQFGRLFTFEKMAKACRLQRTYLSTVINGAGHLNGDQLFAACEFLQLSTDESDFANLLLEWERSQSEKRKKRLKIQIAAMRRHGLNTDNYIPGAKPSADSRGALLDDFYLDLQAQMVHMFLTVPRYSKDHETIRRALGLEKDSFHMALNKIEQAGLISLSGKEVKVLQSSIHLPASSRLYPSYRMQMRLKALELMQNRSPDNHYSFSVLFSADEDARRRMHTRFLEYINWCQKISENETPEQVYQMNFDLVKWG
jgi:hypothetical protein